MLSSSPNWFALRVRSRHEKKVEKALSGAGFEVFLPVYETRRKWSDRVKTVELPLFPGYLFVRTTMDPDHKLAVVRASPGIVEIVGTGRRPAPIPDVEINSIRTLLSSGEQVIPLDRFVPGARVRVVGGPLHGIEGVVLDRQGKRTIVCAVTLLGRAVRTHMTEGNLVPLDHPLRSGV